MHVQSRCKKIQSPCNALHLKILIAHFQEQGRSGSFKEGEQSPKEKASFRAKDPTVNQAQTEAGSVFQSDGTHQSKCTGILCHWTTSYTRQPEILVKFTSSNKENHRNLSSADVVWYVRSTISPFFKRRMQKVFRLTRADTTFDW